MKLCLGTAQFGMDYGVRGQKQPSLDAVMEILDYALHNGADTIDTAAAYGEAETVVGTYFERNREMRQKAEIISKFPPGLLEHAAPEQYYDIMKGSLEKSLRNLHTDYLDGYLLHNASFVYNDQVIAALERLKNEGMVKKIGVSIYEVDEAKAGLQRGDLDFLQHPFSILDQRMLHSGVFALAEEKKIPLYSRSALIQGLILMDEQELPPYLEGAKPLLRQLDELCRKYGLTRVQLAIGFVKQHPAISHLVFGVDDLPQLQEFVSLFSGDIPAAAVEEARACFSSTDPSITIPTHWKK